MENDDNDDVFEDFGEKLEGKKATPRKHAEGIDDEEKLKWKYQEEQQALKDKHKKEMKALEEKKVKDMFKHGKIPSKNLAGVERITYIAIVVILLGYLVFDLSFLHGNDSVDVDVQQSITATVVKEENKSVEPEETVEEEAEEPQETAEEEVQLSGTISLTLDKVYSEVDDNDDELGEISKIVFTIENGKDKVLTPGVEVFIYDDNNKEDYETKSRGTYTFASGIASGKTQTGSIDISPKKFRDLDLKKYIRLTLNDTEEGFITAVNDDFFIS